MGVDTLSTLEKECMIQRFEVALELGWKTLKDYLEFARVTISPVTPRNVIKEAFAAKVCRTRGSGWICSITGTCSPTPTMPRPSRRS